MLFLSVLTALLMPAAFAVPSPAQDFTSLATTLGAQLDLNADYTPGTSKIFDNVSPAVPVVSDLLAQSYAHGVCSFTMQLFQQCKFNPGEDWHTEILGNLFSIEDGNRELAVSFPEGAGRIDGQVKHLLGMGDGLYLSYWTNDVIYFRFDGGMWDTTTNNKDGKAYGLCAWGPWTRDLLDCPKHSDQVRLSDVTCVFKC